MKKIFFIPLVLFFITSFVFCQNDKDIIEMLKSNSITENIFNNPDKQYCFQQFRIISNNNSLVVLSSTRKSLYEKYKDYGYLNNIYILDYDSIVFFDESFYIDTTDISSIFNTQIRNIQLNNSTALLADFNYDENYDLYIFRGDSVSFYTKIIDISNIQNVQEIFHSSEISNEYIKSTEISKIFGKKFNFCILNNKRGFVIPYQIKNKQVITKFYYWSASEQRYTLDETVTQEQIKNANCPEDYFAYNGLKFSKLDSKLTEEDLKELDKAQLRIMRNAVYARHGRTFKSVDLQSLWECYTLYQKNPDYNASLLSEADKYNSNLS